MRAQTNSTAAPMPWEFSRVSSVIRNRKQHLRQQSPGHSLLFRGAARAVERLVLDACIISGVYDMPRLCAKTVTGSLFVLRLALFSPGKRTPFSVTRVWGLCAYHAHTLGGPINEDLSLCVYHSPLPAGFLIDRNMGRMTVFDGERS